MLSGSKDEHIPISSYQTTLQSNLRNKVLCAQEGCTEKPDEQRLDDIYTELYVTAGGNIHINTQHEITQIEMAGKPSDTEQPIKPSELFAPPAGKYKPIRTVQTNGNAGIGKIFLYTSLCWIGLKNEPIKMYILYSHSPFAT